MRLKKRRGEKKAVERGWSSADRFLWQAGARSCKVMLAKLEGLKDKLTFATPLRVWAGTWADTPLWRSGRVRPPEAPTGNQKIKEFFDVFLHAVWELCFSLSVYKTMCFYSTVQVEFKCMQGLVYCKRCKVKLPRLKGNVSVNTEMFHLSISLAFVL